MTATRRCLVLMIALTWLSPGIAGAVDRILLGKTLSVRVGTERSIVIVGREQATDVPAISDPRNFGSTLTIVAAGGTTTTESWPLFRTLWTKIGANAYHYASTSGSPSVRLRVSVRRTAAGLAMLKVGVRGDGPVLPPNPGDAGGVFLAVGGGDRYCVKLGGAAGGTERTDTPTRWKVVNATAEDGCPVVPPVCGNNVREAGEECDGVDQSSCFPVLCRPDCTCETCAQGICSPELGVPCCDPGSVCVNTPGPLGACFNGECDDPTDCIPLGTCVDGSCCAPLGASCLIASVPPAQLPCCGGEECLTLPGLGAVCCLGAGAACEAGGPPCCSGSCNAGTSTCD